MTRIHVSNQGPIAPLVLSIDGHMKKTPGALVDLRVLYAQESDQEKSYAADSGIIVQWLWLEYNNLW